MLVLNAVTAFFKLTSWSSAEIFQLSFIFLQFCPPPPPIKNTPYRHTLKTLLQLWTGTGYYGQLVAEGVSHCGCQYLIVCFVCGDHKADFLQYMYVLYSLTSKIVKTLVSWRIICSPIIQLICFLKNGGLLLCTRTTKAKG